jgi:hypothetical protein
MILLTRYARPISLRSHFLWALLAVALTLFPLSLRASDHADPIHLPQGLEIFDDGKPNAAATARAAGNTTDLFVFPIGADGKLINFPDKEGPPFTAFERNKPPVYLETTEVAQIKGLAVIFCVRPGLRKAPPLDLSGYTYFIHMDLRSRVVFDPASSEFARHGGSIPEPENISPDVTIEIQLNDDTTVKKQTITSPSNIFHNADKVHVYNVKTLTLEEITKSPNDIHLYTGYQANPFIFPKFFATNVVSVVMIIPISAFPEGQRDWLFWGATVGKNGKQFDHVGRSLRTQNPRFDLLDTHPPKDHVRVLRAEDKNPSLMRDLFVKFGFDSFFAYRPWDFTPDVMIYSNRFNVGYPNGRRLDDDVATLLARYGDTLLYELSYASAKFPRDTTIDKPFLADFPYLAAPWPDSPAKAGPALSPRNKVIVGAIVGGILLVVLFAAIGFWSVIKSLFRKRPIPG